MNLRLLPLLLIVGGCIHAMGSAEPVGYDVLGNSVYLVRVSDGSMRPMALMPLSGAVPVYLHATPTFPAPTVYYPVPQPSLREKPIDIAAAAAPEFQPSGLLDQKAKASQGERSWADYSSDEDDDVPVPQWRSCQSSSSQTRVLAGLGVKKKKQAKVSRKPEEDDEGAACTTTTQTTKTLTMQQCLHHQIVLLGGSWNEKELINVVHCRFDQIKSKKDRSDRLEEWAQLYSAFAGSSFVHQKHLTTPGQAKCLFRIGELFIRASKWMEDDTPEMKHTFINFAATCLMRVKHSDKLAFCYRKYLEKDLATTTQFLQVSESDASQSSAKIVAQEPQAGGAAAATDKTVCTSEYADYKAGLAQMFERLKVSLEGISDLRLFVQGEIRNHSDNPAAQAKQIELFRDAFDIFIEGFSGQHNYKKEEGELYFMASNIMRWCYNAIHETDDDASIQARGNSASCAYLYAGKALEEERALHRLKVKHLRLNELNDIAVLKRYDRFQEAKEGIKQAKKEVCAS